MKSRSKCFVVNVGINKMEIILESGKSIAIMKAKYFEI
jgi:hypothetical protein